MRQPPPDPTPLILVADDELVVEELYRQTRPPLKFAGPIEILQYSQEWLAEIKAKRPSQTAPALNTRAERTAPAPNPGTLTLEEAEAVRQGKEALDAYYRQGVRVPQSLTLDEAEAANRSKKALDAHLPEVPTPKKSTGDWNE